jgi:hypothetical protein
MHAQYMYIHTVCLIFQTYKKCMSGSEKLNNIPTYLPTQKNLSQRMANKQFFNL